MIQRCSTCGGFGVPPGAAVMVSTTRIVINRAIKCYGCNGTGYVVTRPATPEEAKEAEVLLPAVGFVTDTRFGGE